MTKNRIYSLADIETTYEKVYDLLVTRDIITNYSTNKFDIRGIALSGLDLLNVKKILELGCGYGFFISALGGRVSPDAEFTGIDVVDNNREAYQNTVASMNYSGAFIKGDAKQISSFADASYDLVIASYSLYFFPGLIPEISRILKKGGLFITVTHSRDSLSEAITLIVAAMKDVGIKVSGDMKITRLFDSFSSENGYQMLKPFFKKVEKLEYENRLVFTDENINDCVYYIEKKKNLIYKELLDTNADNKQITLFKKKAYKMIVDFSKENKGISLNKNDMVFRAWK